MGMSEMVNDSPLPYTFAGILINPLRQTAQYREKDIPLTKVNFRCLKLFLDTPDRVLTPRDILVGLYGEKNAGYRSPRAAVAQVAKVRKALEEIRYREGAIVTLKDIGYRFERK